MNEFSEIYFLDTKQPIDYILETDLYIVACAYDYNENNRSGSISFYDKKDMKLFKSVDTSGTLNAFYSNSFLYCANAGDVSIFKGTDVVLKKETNAINTYIQVDDYIYVSDVSGKITIYNNDLTIRQVISVIKEPIWIFKKYNNDIYFGTEEGYSYRYNLTYNKLDVIGNKRLGIIDIFFENNLIYVASYDDNLYIFNHKDLNLLQIKKKIGSLWKTIKIKDFYYSSSIYNGIQKFDKEFNLIDAYKTESICYAICNTDNKLIWSPFYSKKIEWISI